MIVLGKLFLEETTEKEQMLSSLAHSSLEVHCSYRMKFFVANCSLLGSRFARSCSTRLSQRSKYTEGVVLRMRICIAVQKKNTRGSDLQSTAPFDEHYTCIIPVKLPDYSRIMLYAFADRLFRKLCRHIRRISSGGRNFEDKLRSTLQKKKKEKTTQNKKEV